MMMME